MSMKSITTGRRIATLAVVAALVGSLAAAQPASASPSHPNPPVRAGKQYLALGDSVPFGYRESDSVPTPDYTKPETFVGYPEDVAADLSLDVANASCPGETTASLIDASAPSNGCENGYRLVFPLHVAYSGSQLDFAVQFLRSHRQTRLVSLMAGANDAFLCQKQTADNCLSEFPNLLQSIARNISTILGRIRHEAHYPGQLVLVNYYSLNYADPVLTGEVEALNDAIDAAAQPFDVDVADGFGAFKQATAAFGGNDCAAGLLTMLATGGCDSHVHPSAAGQALLADAVEQVVRTAP
jgi:lysophospholipase L1-like esterase